MFSHFRIVLISIITLSLSFSTTLLNVDFETEGSGYTASATEGTGFTDVFNRSNPDVGGNSSFLWAFEDLSVEDPTLTLNQINVSGYDSFSFSIDLLAHHYNDWDPTNGEDNLKIYYSLDGGDWQNLMWVLPLSNGTDQYNEPAALDTDFDGEAECDYKLPSLSLGTGGAGCVIDNNLFQTFTASDLALSGNQTLDIKFEFLNFTSSDEGGYLDNVVVSGTINGATCDDASACNFGSVGNCTFAGTNEDCAGNCLDGFTADCNGDCGGTAVADCAGICDGTSVIGCDSVCGSNAVNDTCGVCDGNNSTCTDAPANLFFSEYAEGSSSNKYLEIYNASDATVSLNDYRWANCSNGCTEWDYVTSFVTDATIAAWSTYTVCNPSFAGDLTLCDETASVYVNGDDAVGLTYFTWNNEALDRVGAMGADPGSGWAVCGEADATKDHTLVRKSTVSTGNADWAVSAGTDATDCEWVVNAQNYWDDLGSHTCDSAPAADPCAGVDCSGNDTACTTSSCVDGSCVDTNVADGTACDDGNGSTTGDVCNAGSCAGTPVTSEGCLDSNATNYDPNASTQSYTYDDDGNATSSCTYASCADIPDNDDDASTAPLGCLWDTGQSAMWWEGWWNCTDNGGEVCGLGKVVFELDLPNDVTGTPHVQGTYNGWCGSCYNTMDDSDGDGIWSHTQYFSPGEYHEYKFSADVWNSQEDLVGLTDCAVNTDTATNYWNRYFTTGDANTTLTLSSCWGTCDDTCSAPDPCADVTCESGSSCNDTTGLCEVDPLPSVVTFDIDGLDDCGFVSITGSFLDDAGNTWSGWGATNDNNWTVDWNGGVPAGDYEFTILCVDTDVANWWTNIWGASTQYFAPSDCDPNLDDNYANYGFTVDGSGNAMTVSYCAGTCDATCPAPPSGGSSVFITEIADPQNQGGGASGIGDVRFVELYNSGNSAVDLSTWALQRWTNNYTDPQSPVSLTGSIGAGEFYVICNGGDDFAAAYVGSICNQDIGTGGPADSNGDDNIALLGADGSIVDMFGVPGEDGTGTGHEFEDGRAERVGSVTSGNATWDVAEWNIDNDSGGGDGNQYAPEGFDPGSWIGEAGPVGCTDASDCDDSNDYTADSCVDGVCTYVTLECLVDSDCDDNNACTFDSCDQDNTCAYDIGNVGGVCDDGDGFTENDVCDDSGSCSGTALSTVNVTFNLDLNVEGANSPQVRVSHGCVAGCDADFSEGVLDIWLGNTWEDMTDTDGDGVWSYTVALASGVDHTYSYKNGGYESPADDQTCFDDPYGNARHVTPGDSDVSLDSVCWNSCSACPDIVPGCTDDTAVNYNPNATEDDGSCLADWPTPDNLYFAEYAEGSSNNKYLEIYNATDSAVDLSGYSLSSCANGCNGDETAGWTWQYPDNVTFAALTTVAAGDVYVVCHGSADDYIGAECDQTFTYLSNGDDVFALTQMGSGAILDIIGTIGADPGSGWDVAGTYNGTKDHTLVRKSSVTTGNGGQWALSAGSEPSDSEWEVQPKDSWGTLGSHPHAFGCLDSNASNYDASAQFQNYNQYGTSYCTYASCEDTPTYVDATSNTCLWADGTSSNWWEGPWNCGDGTACGYAKVNFSVSATSSASVAGTFNGWSGDSNPLGDADADGVFDGPVWLLPGDYEYKFVVDGNWESLTSGLACTVTAGEFGEYVNRTLSLSESDASSDVDLPTVCEASCYACGFDSCAVNSCESWESCSDPYQVGPVCECSAGDGNVNGAGDINVTDIVAMVGWILGCEGDNDCFTAEQVCRGDLTGDGLVNIIDVTALINIILADRVSYDDATSANIVLSSNTIAINSDGHVAGVQMTLSHGSNFSLDLVDSYVSEYRTVGNRTTLILATIDNSLEEIATYKGSFEVESIILCNSSNEISDVNIINVNSIEVKLAGPNPFNPSTSLNIVVAQDGYVSVNVYNLVGQKVATLLDGYMNTNLNGYPVNFNGSNLASGVYLVRAETAGNVSTQKLMLLK